MSSSFAQGKNLLQNIKNKITEGFSLNRRDGFSGILGSNAAMDSVLASDLLTTKTVDASYNKNIRTYSDSYSALQSKTELYLNDPDNNGDLNKNYNVFINKSLNQDKISETSLFGCVNFAALDANNLSRDPKFNTAYPANFTNYADAENACKLWAADSNSTTYGLAQDSASKYNCYRGSTTINPSTATYTKPKVLYSILLGDTSKTEGGLFKNGQIGIWSGKKADLIDPSWNIPNMMVPQLVKKYNNTDYSTGPYGDVKAITDNWWGVPTSKDENGSLKKKDGDGWGFNFWPTDTTAWWISCSDYYLVGTMGYFYYVYDNTGEARKIYIYVVADDNRVLKVNGTRPKLAFSWEREDILWGSIYAADLLVGKNVFELKLINTGGPGAFVFYALDYSNFYNVLFTSDSASTVAAEASKSASTSTAGAGLSTGEAGTGTGADPSTAGIEGTASTSTADTGPQLAYGWGYSKTPVSDYKKVNNMTTNADYMQGIKTVNNVPNNYAMCNPYYGGGINKSSITASYGRNCNNVANPPLNVRYVMIQANPQGESLQIAQVVVNAIVKNTLTNVMLYGDVALYASSVYPYGNTNVYWTKDGTYAPKAYPKIFHSGGYKGDWWFADLKRDYPVVQIIYYNRSDCCSERAKGMSLYLFDDTKKHIGTGTLTGALVQSFSVSTVGIKLS